MSTLINNTILSSQPVILHNFDNDTNKYTKIIKQQISEKNSNDLISITIDKENFYNCSSISYDKSYIIKPNTAFKIINVYNNYEYKHNGNNIIVYNFNLQCIKLM